MSKFVMSPYDIAQELRKPGSPWQKVVAYINILSHEKQRFIEQIKQICVENSLIEEFVQKLEFKEAKLLSEKHAAIINIQQQQQLDSANAEIERVSLEFSRLIQDSQTIARNIAKETRALVEIKKDLIQNVRQEAVQAIKAEIPPVSSNKQSEIVDTTTKVIEERFDKFIRKVSDISIPLLKPTPAQNVRWSKTYQEEIEKAQQELLQRKIEKAVAKLEQRLLEHRLSEAYYSRMRDCICHGFEHGLCKLNQTMQLMRHQQAIMLQMNDLFRNYGNTLSHDSANNNTYSHLNSYTPS